MFTVRARLTLLGLFLPAINYAAPPVVPTEATQDFLDANEGVRALTHGEGLAALYGPAFASDADPQTSTQDFVESFVAANADALGVEGVTLVLDHTDNIRDNKFKVFTYTQESEDLPAHNTVVFHGQHAPGFFCRFNKHFVV